MGWPPAVLWDLSSESAANLGGVPDVWGGGSQCNENKMEVGGCYRGVGAAVGSASGVPGTHWLVLLLQGGSEMKH